MEGTTLEGAVPISRDQCYGYHEVEEHKYMDSMIRTCVINNSNTQAPCFVCVN